jgi:hypothetical protein
MLFVVHKLLKTQRTTTKLELIIGRVNEPLDIQTFFTILNYTITLLAATA